MTVTPETTLVGQWLRNPIFAFHAFWRKHAAQVLSEHSSDGDANTRSDVVFELAVRLEQVVAGQADRTLQGLGLYQALLESALERIDWSSLAEALRKQSSQQQGWKAVERLLTTTERTKLLTKAHGLRSSNHEPPAQTI